MFAIDSGDMISKQTFLLALGCDAAGWFAEQKQREAPGPGVEWRFHTGAEIGRLARRQLGDGLLLPFAPTEAALRATAEAVADPMRTLLFEATFTAGEFIARADALRRGTDGWEVIEVKSALEPEGGKFKDEHADDLAYTVFVAIASGMPVRKCTLMFLSRDSRLGAVTFAELDATASTLARAAEFTDHAARIVRACTADTAPPAALQFICKKCDFFATECIGKEVPDPLFLLPRLSEKRFVELKPYQRLSAVPASPNLTAPQHRVFNAVRSGVPFVDAAVLAQLNTLEWPVYYLDFEAVTPALPWFAECAPYETTVFQYSIHVCDRVGHEVAHHEYLAPIGGDWRRDMVASMLDALGTHGSIAMYTGYEKLRLAEMRERFPDMASALQAIIDRLVDFEPILRNGYCHPEFGGRTSIKNVLPVVAPELAYAGLTVGNGLDAEGLFALMTVGHRDPADHAAHRDDLLMYCKLDTLAMVRLHQALATLVT